MTLRRSVDPNGVAEVVMEDAPGRNSLTPGFVDALMRELGAVAADETAKVLLLRGLPDVFCSGADRDTLIRLCRKEIRPVDIVLPKAVLDLPIPVIAAMEGHAVGGGFALGLCADIVLLAEDSRYGCSFMNMGFTPGMGITRLMEHFMPPAVAVELQFTGTFHTGASFRGRSGFNAILPRAAVLNEARTMAAAIAEKPRQSLVLLKRYQSLARRKAFEESHTVETMMHEISLAQPDAAQQVFENFIHG